MSTRMQVALADPPQSRHARTSKSLRAVLPIVSAFVIFSFLAITPADADLWGHLTFGRDIVRAGSVQHSDSYSFTSDQAWINHEWLAEVTMWTAYRLAGAPGLVALKLLLACLIALALLETWRPHALPAAWRDGLLCALAIGTWPQVQFMRPQVFSLVLFAWLLVVLQKRDVRGDVRWLFAVPPIFAAWVNFHGGWIVGIVVLMMYATCELFDRASPVRRKAAMASAAAVSLLATLCNPYGTRMLAFLADTVRPERADIVEWQPLASTSGFIVILWLVPAGLAAVALWRGKRQVPTASLLTTLVLAIGSLHVVRLIGFFTIGVGVLLVPHLRRAAVAEHRSTADPLATRQMRPEPDPASRVALDVGSGLRRISHPLAVCLVACAIALPLFGNQITVDAPWLPEPEAATFIKRGLRGRMLTWFDYGQYAIWHLAPAIRVSMDGRRETVYSDRVRAIHARIYANDPTAMEEVAKLNPDHAWLPRACPVIPTLEAHGWHRVFEGPRSVVLTRSANAPVVRTTGAVAPRPFPGP